MELPNNRPTKDPYQEIPVKDFSYINTQNAPTKKSKPVAWIVSGIIVLVLLGAGAFAYGHYTKNSKPKTKSETHKTVTDNKASSSSTVQLTSYTSNSFGLTVSYPTSWTVGSEGSSLNITSPTTNLTADTGKTVMGREVVSIFNQGQIPAGFGTGSLAVLNSQDINFTNPSTSQAAQTYVSFVQYPATNIVGGMDAIYITGNDGYTKDQAIPTTDVDQISPLIIVSFQSCQNSACSNPTNLTISSSMWSSSSFSTPILDILKSFVFLS